jgi:hypothetical protein
MAAVEAINRLRGPQTELRVGKPDVPRVYSDKSNKVSLYFMGCAAALRATTISTFPDYSGSFGKGYNWVVHQMMNKLKLNPNYFKGNSVSPNTIITGSAWGSQLNSGTIKLIALIKRGAQALRFASPHLWLRSYESFRGNEIKKDLKHRRVGILSQIEVDYLSRRFPNIEEGYESFKGELRTATLEFCEAIPQRLAALNRAAKPAEILASTTVQRRIQASLPTSKKLREKALKRPIKESFDEMDGEAYIAAFNPAELATNQRFQVNLDEFNPEDGAEFRRGMLIQQYYQATQMITDEQFRRDCRDWFAATLAAKLNL